MTVMACTSLGEKSAANRVIFTCGTMTGDGGILLLASSLANARGGAAPTLTLCCTYAAQLRARLILRLSRQLPSSVTGVRSALRRSC